MDSLVINIKELRQKYSQADQIAFLNQLIDQQLFKRQTIHTELGRFQLRSISQRHFLVFQPVGVDSPLNLYLHLHGSRGYFWQQALFQTDLILKACQLRMIVVFGQSSGQFVRPYIHQHYGGVCFGDMYWEIRTFLPQFQMDISYIQSIINIVQKQFLCRKVILGGYSNGGVFGCQAAIFLGNLLDGFCSWNGGTGWDMTYQLNFQDKRIPKPLKKIKLLFITGQKDQHREPSHIAHNIFETQGYDSRIIQKEGAGHQYLSELQTQCIKYLALD